MPSVSTALPLRLLVRRLKEAAVADNRTYIETALAEDTGKTDYQKDFLAHKASNPGGAPVPPLTAEQDEALDLVAAIAEESCLQQRFELGDLQLSSK